MNTKRCVCVCSFCLGQESARIWSKWLAWVCAWQVSRERAGKSRGEFQEVAKAFHFGFRLKISVFWHLDLKSTLLSTFNLWPLLSRPRVDLRYPIKCEKLQQLGWRAEVSWTEGIRQTGTVTHTHSHSLPVWCVSDSCASCFYSEMVPRQPRLLVRHQRRPTTNQARVWKCCHHSGPDQLWILTDRKRLNFFSIQVISRDIYVAQRPSWLV